jgi:hypothetical protein
MHSWNDNLIKRTNRPTTQAEKAIKNTALSSKSELLTSSTSWHRSMKKLPHLSKKDQQLFATYCTAVALCFFGNNQTEYDDNNMLAGSMLLCQLNLLWLYLLQKRRRKVQVVEEWIDRGKTSYSVTSNRVRDLKRLLNAMEGGHDVSEDRPLKKLRRKFDHQRAEMCIDQDYWGEDPLFNDLQFQRMFSCTRHVAKRLIQAAVENRPDVFFEDLTGQRKVRAHVKVLNILKILRFGVSFVAFEDYFQFSESGVRLAFHAFCDAVSNDAELTSTFLPTMMTRQDAEKAQKLHKDKHGIDGMAFSIDCCHIYWKNCPTAWKGQFENGKNDRPSIVLEAGIDYDLFFWHVAFGFPGTQNDLVIWDRSHLHTSLEDGTWNTEVDPFESFFIGGEEFNELFFLVDGIYPPLSRFVKTIPVPVNDQEVGYVTWQEGSRKDVERGFGCWQSKFRWLIRPIELWDPIQIRNAVLSCIIIHNMMVRYRQSLGTTEDYIFYAVNAAIRNKLQTESKFEKETIEVLRELGLVEDDSDNEEDETMERVREDRGLSIRSGKDRTRLEREIETRLLEMRIGSLQDRQEHFRLRKAITRELCE